MGTRTDRGPGTYRPIGDYALIGDCRTAALISSDGSLDWLCLPRFDSPSVFGALLDARRGGRFRIRPVGSFRTERRYIPETNVLETTFHAAGGTIRLRDAMAIASRQARQAGNTPDHEVLREVKGLEGEVEVEVDYEPRPDYGRRRPKLRTGEPSSVWSDVGNGRLVLSSEVPLALNDGQAAGVARIRAGERRGFSLAYGGSDLNAAPTLGAAAHDRLERTARWWRDWAQRATYDGPYRDAVVRSALVLKLLTYAPSGAVVAAPTTSLPEAVGGVRNWDYRYCWLRDASFTLRALFALGYHEEGEAFARWVIAMTATTLPELQTVYAVDGEPHLPERELAHLEGYMGSRPVRIGNEAHSQLQLDVFGEALDAVARFAYTEGVFDEGERRLLIELGRAVCARWREPDEGIWEWRSGRFQHTHSKVLGWVALDCLIKMHEAEDLHLDDVAEFQLQRDAIRAEIEAHGYNARLHSYTCTFDGDDLDASLLTLPLYGYIDAADPRMRGTCARIRQRLGRGNLVYRYGPSIDDGMPPGEGAFGICSFWAVECLALGGDAPAARAAYEQLLTYANDVGLFAEEIDPDTGTALGNFPQAFTHVGLINAALRLAEGRGGERVPATARTRHHADGLLSEWKHRTFWHTHEHNHNTLTHSHEYSQKDEEEHHAKEAHIHDHAEPTESQRRGRSW